MIPRGNMIEAARLGYHAGENIESAGRTFGIGGGGGVGGKRQTFDLALRCRASRRLVLRTKSFPSRCTPCRGNVRFASVEANSYRAEKLDIFAQTLVTKARLGVRTRSQRCTSEMR
jgi:hypothetical protein